MILLKKSSSKIIRKFNIINKLFANKDGQLVLGQLPNPPMIIWLVTMGVYFSGILPRFSESLYLIGNAFLFVWAYMELTQGVNLFRKLLGGVLLAFIIILIFLNFS